MKPNNQYLSEVGRFIHQYSVNTYGNDYQLTMDYIPTKHYRKHRFMKMEIERLKNHLYKKRMVTTIDGIYSTEYDSSKWKLHLHSLLYIDTQYPLSKVRGEIYNYLKHRGSVNIQQYNPILGYSNYITKHLNKTDNNEWDFIGIPMM